MGINFPAAPIIGELYPTPAIAGIPQYKWDGTAWLAMTPSALTYVQRGGDTMTGALNVVTPPTLPAHAASKAYVDALGVASAPLEALNYSGMQINGSMEVSQELGAGGRTTSGYICDGWRCGLSGTMAYVAVVDANGGGIFPLFQNYRFLVSVNTAQVSLGAADYTQIQQYIEGWRCARLNWGTANAQPITIGFWTAHARTGTYSVVVRNGVDDRSYATTYTQAVANIAQYNVITIPGPTTGSWTTDNTSGLKIVFSLGCGTTFTAPSVGSWLSGNYIAAPGQVNAVAATSDNFRLTGVVVLPGIYAPTAAQSPLIMRPYDQELITCQRYFSKREYSSGARFVGHKIPGSGFMDVYPFPVTMRATPTMSMNNNVNWNYVNASNVDTAFTGISAGTNSYQYGKFLAGPVDGDSVPRQYYYSIGGVGIIYADARL
jgi:hypothetical protein